MGLKIWLPLIGNLKNKGASDVTVVNSGATVDNSGKIGQCYSFDGSDDYISLESQALYSTFKGGSQPFSIAFWVYHNDSSRAILFGDYQLTGAINFNIELTTSHTFRFYWAGTPDKTFTGSSVGANTWTHVCVTYDGSKIVTYINGIALSDIYSGTLASKNKTTGVYYLGRDSRTGTTALNGKLNDFRVYDHCLSVAEVKEISKGLVLHYKLDDPIVGVKFYDYLQSTGTQWIDTGVKGYMNHTYEIDFQQTDAGNYRIWGVFGQSSYVGYNMSLTYGNGWIARWNNTSNGQELVSLGTINTNRHVFKVVNGQCYFDGISKGTSSGHNSGFSIDNNLFLFTINPANTTPSTNSKCKIYSYKDIDSSGKVIRNMVPCTYNGVAGMWDKVENKFYGNLGTGTFTLGTPLATDNTIIDSSGYGKNGIITGEALANLNSPRYSATILTTNVSSYSTITCSNLSLPDGPVTLSFWSKPTVSDTVDTSKIEIRFSNCWYFTYVNYTYFIHNGDYKYRWTNPWSDGNWHLVTGVFDGTNTKIYVDGIEATVRTGTETTTNTFRNELAINFRGNSISDFRIYSTALSADDILQLYQVSGKVDNLGGIHSYEFIEEANASTKILKTGIAKAQLVSELLTNQYDNNFYIEPDGSVWVRIVRHNNPASYKFNSTDPFTTKVYIDENRWFKASLCNKISGSWELMCKQKATSDSAETKYRWVQSYNPMTATFNQTTASNVTVNTSAGYTSGHGGLYYNNGTNSYLVRNNGTNGNWWGSVGCWTDWNGGIPGFGGATVTTGYVDLYLRIDNTNVDLASFGINNISAKQLIEI